MKVTEWNGPRTSVERPNVILPEVVYPSQETIVVPSHTVEQYPIHAHPHSSEVIIDHGSSADPASDSDSGPCTAASADGCANCSTAGIRTNSDACVRIACNPGAADGSFGLGASADAPATPDQVSNESMKPTFSVWRGVGFFRLRSELQTSTGLKP